MKVLSELGWYQFALGNAACLNSFTFTPLKFPFVSVGLYICSIVHCVSFIYGISSSIIYTALCVMCGEEKLIMVCTWNISYLLCCPPPTKQIFGHLLQLSLSVVPGVSTNVFSRVKGRWSNKYNLVQGDGQREE